MSNVAGTFTGVIRDEITLINAELAAAQQYYASSASASACRDNMPRLLADANLSALTTAVMLSVAINLREGDVVTNLSFCSGATAANTPLNQWFALYSAAATPALLEQTADDTTTAWGANTVKTLALASPYTVTATGIYFASIMVKATTPPTLLGHTGHAYSSDPWLTGDKILARTSASGLTTTAPATIATATTVATIPRVVIS